MCYAFWSYSSSFLIVGAIECLKPDRCALIAARRDLSCKMFSLYDSQERTFFIFILQTIDEWIQHWNDSGIEYRCHLCLGQGWCVIRLQICENQGPIEDSHTHDVGHTGRKGFFSAWCRLGPQDGWDNDNIGDNDYKRELRMVSPAKTKISISVLNACTQYRGKRAMVSQKMWLMLESQNAKLLITQMDIRELVKPTVCSIVPSQLHPFWDIITEYSKGFQVVT